MNRHEGDARALGERKAKDLAAKYIKNFEQYTNTEEGKRLVNAGPKL